MNKFKYETHCHSAQSSGCAKVNSKDVVRFYASKGYTGLWFTDHFSVSKSDSTSWAERIEKLRIGFDEAKETAAECGIDLFMGWEYTHSPEAGTDFLTYGLSTVSLLEHPEIRDMNTRQYLSFAREAGALIVHAHPFRAAGYIEMIRLLPDCIDMVEVLNSNRTDFENDRAKDYASAYGLPFMAGTDNHRGSQQPRLCGVALESRALSSKDWCDIIRSGKYHLFDERND